MMRTALSIVTVWRSTVRTTDDIQATVTLDPVKQREQTVTVGLQLRLTFTLPPQDEYLPHTIEAHVHQAGLEVQRALFRALIEHADRQLVLTSRGGKGGQGVQLRGTRPFTFKTVFGTVEVDRVRVTHKADGSSLTPSGHLRSAALSSQLSRGREVAGAMPVFHARGKVSGVTSSRPGSDSTGRRSARSRSRRYRRASSRSAACASSRPRRACRSRGCRRARASCPG